MPKEKSREELINLAAKTARSRERPRSTFFLDETDKAERRNKRKHTDKQLIQEELEEDSDIYDLNYDY